MQKSFGYRFVITNASFPSTVASGGAMSVSLTVVNKGCAPFYYQWPVKASLLKADKTPAWSGTFTTDIRKWMPDSTNTVSGSFSIPSGLSSGIYTLAFSVNDPAGDLPSLRFANTNYFTGGYTPVGKVGIGMDATDQSLGNFDGLQADNTLRYKLTSSATDTIAPTTPLHLTMAAHTDTTVTLSWDAATDNVGVLGYALYKNGAYYASSTTTSVVAGGLLSQTANSFTVKAIDGAGNESTPSEALSASTDIRRYTSYEAELTGNTLTGTAVVATETHCSGQKKVGYIGNTTGTLQFNSVTAPAAGNYLMTIYFLSAVSRDLTLTINRGQPRTITCLPSGGWTSVGDTSITVTIDKGNNTISFSNATGWAPDIDRIVLNIPEDHAVKATKSQAAGTADGKMSCFFKNGQLRILFGKKSPKGPLQLSLFNCNGRLVGTSTAEIVGSGVNEVKFADVEKSFTSGYFIITIQANGKYIFSRKVVTLN
jgi:chitodextrinase